MPLSNLSQDEQVRFYKKLQLRYEEEYKTMQQLVPFSTLLTTDINLIPKKETKDVDNYSITKINSNEIVYYSNKQKNNVFYLLKHLRNSIAHNNINKKDLNGISHYQFIDREKVKNKYQKTMKGFIKATDWEKFVDFIYEKSKLLQTTTNTPIQGKIDLSSSSNTDIAAVKGKIQL